MQLTAFGAILLLLLAAAPAPSTEAVPQLLTLERAFPVSLGVGVSKLRDRDRLRHTRMLSQSDSVVSGVADFALGGTYNPLFIGLYYAKVQIGTPPKEYYVQIDTGSDVLWISCMPCYGCPQSSGLNVPLNLFDPKSSSSASEIFCGDKRCNSGFQTAEAVCSSENNACSYSFRYGDGSGTSGYYVSDLLTFEMVLGESTRANSSATIVFGCSTEQTGELTKSDKTVDGIFGFGQQKMSVISQLASHGVAPRAFSHCLRGDGDGGGLLVFGEIVEPNMVYTPLVPLQPYYSLNLESISVNGQILPIDPSAFATSSNRGTIVDTGTTLTYLVEEAYDPFVNAITAAVSPNVRELIHEETQCYLISSNVNDAFPLVSLNFAGGTSMILSPPDYLVLQNSFDGNALWCIGFQMRRGQGITILGGINHAAIFVGDKIDTNIIINRDFFLLPLTAQLSLFLSDLVLKDKIFVYDLAGQRLGWTNYDCSSSVNVSLVTNTGKSENVDPRRMRNSTSRLFVPYNMTLWCMILSLTISSIIRRPLDL